MDYTGTFDSLAVDFATNKQKASLTLNEDARQAFENLRGKQIAITIKALILNAHVADMNI